MKLKVVRDAVTSKVGRQILIGKKHSPTILFAGGIVGVVATTVVACRATLKLEEVLEQAEKDHEIARTLVNEKYNETDRVQDHAKIKVRTAGKIVKLYAPAVGLGVASVACLTGSHVVLTKRNAAVMAAYSVLEKGFNDYRERVRDEYGEEKDREYRFGTETRTVVEETAKGTKVQEIQVPKDHSVYARFFDDTSRFWDRTPEYNLAFLKSQQNFANDRLRMRGYLFLNEVYDALGLPITKAGQAVGWVISKDGDNFVDFGIFRGDERSRVFVNGFEHNILLDFNVDGVIWDKI